MSPESTCLQTLEVGIWVGVGQGKTYGKSFWPCGTLGHTTHSRSALLLCSTCKATGDKFVCPLLLNSTGNNEVNGEVSTESVVLEGSHNIQVHLFFLFYVLYQLMLPWAKVLPLPNPLPTTQVNFCSKKKKFHYLSTYSLAVGFFMYH